MNFKRLFSSSGPYLIIISTDYRDGERQNNICYAQTIIATKRETKKRIRNQPFFPLDNMQNNDPDEVYTQYHPAHSSILTIQPKELLVIFSFLFYSESDDDYYSSLIAFATHLCSLLLL